MASIVAAGSVCTASTVSELGVAAVAGGSCWLLLRAAAAAAVGSALLLLLLGLLSALLLGWLEEALQATGPRLLGAQRGCNGHAAAAGVIRPWWLRRRLR